jgi:hypothetical protein
MFAARRKTNRTRKMDGLDGIAGGLFSTAMILEPGNGISPQRALRNNR